MSISKTPSFQIHFAQIESGFESIDGVKSACAADLDQGKVLAVLVTKHQNADISQEVLKNVADEKLPNLSFDGGIYIVDEIPRTNSVANKVVRADARKLVLKLINQAKK
jgi:acyl-coenzyme A synthetase/AMP-(fatty) acid ligase